MAAFAEVTFDTSAGSAEMTTLGPGRLVPARNITLPEASGVSWHDPAIAIPLARYAKVSAQIDF